VTATDPTPMQRQLTNLLGICKVLSARISAQDELIATLCAKLKIDPGPPKIGPDDVPLKKAAGELGMSINGVKYHCRHGRLRRIDVGSRVFIDRKTIESFKVMQNCSARAPRRAR
jgi:hypothetical protein